MCNRMPPHIPGHCPPTEPAACPFCDDPHCKGLGDHQVETIDDIAADRDRLVPQLAAAESRARAAEADCAAMREALAGIVEKSIGEPWTANDQKYVRAALTPRPGAPLLAELEAARELIEILRDQIWSHRHPSESFERIAEQFYRETRFLAPGKSLPMEMVVNDEDRHAAWLKWSNERYEKLIVERAALLAKYDAARGVK